MILHVKSTDKLKGQIRLPGSKSYSIRAFIIAACGGTSTIIQPSNCEDACVALNTAKAFGANISQQKNKYLVKARVNMPQLKKLNVNESGTTLRFVLPLLPLFTKTARIVGKGTLKGRPNQFLCETLRANGVDIYGTGAGEGIPIILKEGMLSGGKMSIDGSISSQFISALLIALPQINVDTRLKLTGKKIVSTDYIAMTDQILQRAKIKVSQKSAREFMIKGGQKYKGLGSFIVPSDYGLIAFPMAAAAINDSNITLKGNFDSQYIQADGHILSFLKKMGVKFSKTRRSIKVRGPFNLKGGVFSLKNCPDLVPIMSVLALFAKGKTVLKDIAHAKAKESDRISDLRHELLKVGANVQETATSLTIIPQTNYKSNVLLDPHKDHRLAMAFAVLGTRIGVRIKNMECTHKSYPDFVKDFETLINK